MLYTILSNKDCFSDWANGVGVLGDDVGGYPSALWNGYVALKPNKMTTTTTTMAVTKGVVSLSWTLV